MSNKPPKIVIPGMNRGAGIPGGYILGRRRGGKQGPVELLNLAQVVGMGIATTTQVTDSTSTVQSIAHSETVSLSRGVSTSLSGAISSTSSLSSAVSTVISGSISSVNSSITSLSTAIGGGTGTSTSLSQISSSLSAEISTDLSRINSLSTAVGGGGGGGTVSLVQSKTVIGDTALNSITLGANPTAGNMLVLLGTHWTSALTAAQGWNIIVNTGGVADGEICMWKLVNATDAGSAVIAPFTGGASGQMGVVFEVSGALAITSGAFEHFKETTATAQTLNAVATKAGCLLVGFFGTLSSNTAPTSITNVTTLANLTGTTTNGSPRQLTPFYNSFGAAGSLASVCTYASSHSQYGAAYVLLPA